MNTTPLTRMCLLLIVAFMLADSVYASNALQETNTGITDETAAANIPIQLDPTHIFLELKVNGKGPFSFALDTGASHSAVSSRTAKEAGLETFGDFGVGGVGENERKAQMARGVNFELPGVVLADQTVISLDLDDFEQNKGRRVDGILGFDFFNNFIVEIDYAASRLRVFDPESYQHDGTGEVVPLTIGHMRVPHFQATINLPGREAINGDFLLDTGAALQAELMKPFALEHDVAGSLKTKW